MTAPRTEEELHAAIDRLLLDYLSEVRRSVATRMMERQFQRDRILPSSTPQKQRPGKSAASPRPRAAHTRRSSDELRALGLRLVDLIREDPGMGMSHYSDRLGVSPKDLWRPSVVMRKEKRIRTIGSKGATKYFPVYT